MVVPTEYVKKGKKDSYPCTKTGCSSVATGNVDAKDFRFKTNMSVIHEFCAEHGKSLEEYYVEKYGNN